MFRERMQRYKKTNYSTSCAYWPLLEGSEEAIKATEAIVLATCKFQLNERFIFLPLCFAGRQFLIENRILEARTLFACSADYLKACLAVYKRAIDQLLAFIEQQSASAQLRQMKQKAAALKRASQPANSMMVLEI